MKFQEFKRGEPGVKPKILRQKTNLPPNFHVVGGCAKNEGLSAAGFYQSQQHFYGCTFPRAIGAEKAEHFAAPHCQRKIAYSNLFPKYFAQFQRLNGKVGRLIQMPLREPTDLVQRVRQRHRIAGIAVADEPIDDPILYPN